MAFPHVQKARQRDREELLKARRGDTEMLSAALSTPTSTVPVPSPTTSRFVDGDAPYPGYGAGGNIAGLSTHAFWNKPIYAELGGYGTSGGPETLSFALLSCPSHGLWERDESRVSPQNLNSLEQSIRVP